MRIAIYARVSTDDKGQDPENQLRQLRQWCASAGHELVHQYVDHESGKKGTKDRKQFAALFEQFRTQVLAHLPADPGALSRLHLMPTNGTRYYRFVDGGWRLVKTITAFTEGRPGPQAVRPAVRGRT